MRRSDSEQRTAPVDQLAELSAAHPEWARWIELYREALALRGPEDGPAVTWSSIEPRTLPNASPTEVGAPLLDGMILQLPSDAPLRFAERRTEGPGSGALQPGYAARLVEAAIACDGGAIAALAAERGAEPAALRALADLAVLPVLLDVGRVAGEPPPGWSHGYCPTCGAWAALAEILGLEGERRLRCSRCGTGWRRDILHCAFCGERDHRQQVALADHGREDREWIEACRSCHGYTKSFARLAATPAEEVALKDLASVELDIVALERGYRRPEASGYPARVRLEVNA